MKITIPLKKSSSIDDENNKHLDKNPNGYDINLSNKHEDEYKSTAGILKSQTQNTKLFKSRIHELIFCFQTNISELDTSIGLKKIHYYKKSRANDLEKLYLSIFHPDKKLYLIKEIMTTDKDAAKDLNDIDFNIICSQIKLLFKRVTGGLNE